MKHDSLGLCLAQDGTMPEEGRSDTKIIVSYQARLSALRSRAAASASRARVA